MSTVSRPRKPKTENRKPKVRDERFTEKVKILDLPIDKVHPHPDNRPIEPDSVTELAESIGQYGQHEPVRVRPHADLIGHYELISGGRRLAACKLLRRTVIWAIVDEVELPEGAVGERSSLVDLAIANAHRKDLDAIERAELLQRMIDAGEPADQAGRVFGLNSESGVKNTLRLLQLPDAVRAMVKSGELTIKQARVLVPYPHAFLSAFLEHLGQKNSEWSRRRFLEDEDGTETAIENFARMNCRPVDKRKHYHNYQQGEHPALFKLDSLNEKQRASLNVVEVPASTFGGKQGSTCLIATNRDAWHKLQDPLVEAKLKERKSKQAAKTKADKAKPLTPAELKARRANQDAHLRSFTEDWLRTAYRSLIADRMRDSAKGHYFALWLLDRYGRESKYSDPGLSRLCEWASDILEIHPAINIYSSASTVETVFSDPQFDDADFLSLVVQLILWPASRPAEAKHKDLAAYGEVPDNLPTLDDETVDSLAECYGISPETVWREAVFLTGWPGTESVQRKLVRQWLARHTKDQLCTLAAQLGLTIDNLQKHAAQVEELLAHHTDDSPLPLPTMFKSDKPSVPKRKQGGAR